jgi:hypothetical protein
VPKEFPEFPRISASRKTAGHADDSDRFIPQFRVH